MVSDLSLPKAAREERRIRFGLAAREHWFAYALLAPTLVLLTILILYPVASAVYISLTNTAFINPTPIFVGLDNYRSVLASPVFVQILANSLIWTVGVVVFQFVVGMATAILLNQPFAGRGLLRALVIVPWVMPGIIGGILWKLMYDPYLGLVNAFLMKIHVTDHNIAWLAQPDTVMAAIIFAAIWKGAPFSTLMYLAALQNVSSDLVEAAQLDGATWWQRLRSVDPPRNGPDHSHHHPAHHGLDVQLLRSHLHHDPRRTR